MTANKHYRTGLSTYKESEALQQLMQTIDTALSDERFKQSEDDVMSDEILITIGGTQTAFYLGGPQVDGLMAFIDHIANENCYEVDFKNSTVVE